MKSGSEEAGSLRYSSSVDDTIIEQISSNIEEPFYVFDVQDMMKKHKNWLLRMPRIRPYYAVKCNPCPPVLELLAALGCGFDCASKGEIDTVLAMNVSPSNIIYANPCKSNAYIKHAAAVGVETMTFDNEYELYKVAKHFPEARLVIRIKVDDSHAVCRFSSKFGADLDQVSHLLTTAKGLGLIVVGVSFHVGSGCENAKSYADAISNARYVFDLAKDLGYQFKLLDIGGGFPGTSKAKVSFHEIAAVVNEALNHHFPKSMDDVTIIAEPGRYYVASAFTLNALVIAKRSVKTDSGKEVMYYLNDGVYGSFNCIIFDHWVVDPVPLLSKPTREQFPSILWGPTCDSMDCIKKDVLLPEMNIGEWIMFREMGAYTIAAASTFNGFMLPSIKFHLSGYTLEAIRNLPSWPRIAKTMNLDENEPSDTKEAFGINHLGLIPVH